MKPMDLETAKTIVENHEGWPPLTDDAKANFLLDVAQNQVMDQPPLFGETLELSDWEDQKERYEQEVEAVAGFETHSVEELKEKYL
jgi:hypothetical protein